MGVLVFLFAEIAIEVLGAAIVVLADLIASLVVLLLSATRLQTWPKIRLRLSAQSLLWMRRVAITCLAIPILAFCAANFLFFEQTVRWMVCASLARVGTEVTFSRAAGSLFTGTISLRDARLSRAKNANSTFDIRMDVAEINIEMLPLVVGRVRFEEVTLTGVRGNYTRCGSPERLRARKGFEIGRLHVRECALNVEDRAAGGIPHSFDVRVDELESSPFRSRWALFDMLFRTDAAGTIDDADFAWHHGKGNGTPHSADWRVNRLVLAKIGTLVGWPLNWLDAGLLSFVAESEYGSDDSTMLRMRCKIHMTNVAGSVPEDVSVADREVMERVIGYLNSNAEHIHLNFEFALPLAPFEEAGSVIETGLLDGFNESFWRAMAASAGVDFKRLDELGRKSAEKLRERFKSLRK